MDYRTYDRVYHFFLRGIVYPLIKKKLHFEGESIPAGAGPKLILCNHNTDLDFLLIAGVCSEATDVVGTETVLRMNPVIRFAAKKLKPILHDKGSKGLGTIKQIVERIRDGRNVLLFPEGNRSFDGRTGEISKSLGRIASMAGCTIVVYRLTGGYFTSPRWGRGIRKGRMAGKVTRILTPKDIGEMSAAQVQRSLEEGLATDAYKEQEMEPVRFKGKAKAEYLETLLFRCPSCKKIAALKSKKDKVRCVCGFELTMDEYGFLVDQNGERHTVTKMFADQKEYLRELLNEARSLQKPLWEDHVQMTQLGADHKVLSREKITLTVLPDQIRIGEKVFDYGQIENVDIVQRNRLLIHVKKSVQHYEFIGEKTFNAVKYLLWHEKDLHGKEGDS